MEDDFVKRPIDNLRKLERLLDAAGVDIFTGKEDEPAKVEMFQHLLGGLASLPVVAPTDSTNEPGGLCRYKDDLDELFAPWRAICTWVTCSHWRADTGQRETVINVNPQNVLPMIPDSIKGSVSTAADQREIQFLMNYIHRVWACYYFINAQCSRKNASLATVNKFLAVHARYKLPLQMLFGSGANKGRRVGSLRVIIQPSFANKLAGVLHKPLFDYLAKPFEDHLNSYFRQLVFSSREVDIPEHEFPNAVEIQQALQQGFQLVRKNCRRQLRRWQVQILENWGVQVTEEGVCVLVLPMLLYRWYFATPYFYSFPVPLTFNRASVLSIATTDALDDREIEHYQAIATRLFTSALMRDHVFRAGREQLNTRLYNFTRMVGHNFPKLFSMPFGRQLNNIRATLEAPRYRDLYKELEPRLTVMHLLLNHYDKLFRVLIGGVGLKKVFSQLDISTVDFQHEALPTIEKVFGLFRESRLHRDADNSVPLASLRSHLQLNAYVSKGLTLRSPYYFVLEIIFNVINNALNSIDANDVEKEPSRGTVRITAERYRTDLSSKKKPLLKFSVQDGGVGISKQKLKKLVKLMNTIKLASEETLWMLADAEISRSKAHEEHLGLGLLFSAVFLRSLEWHKGIGQGGWIEIFSTRGEGTTVTLLIPELDQNNFRPINGMHPTIC